MLYERSESFKRGTFRVRGDIVELFPPYSGDNAVRFEFFGDDIDSISEFDPLTGKVGAQLNIESIQEIEVKTAGASAEFGRAQGGFANIVTKSGGNEFQGTFKFFWRGSTLDGDGAGFVGRYRPGCSNQAVMGGVSPSGDIGDGAAVVSDFIADTDVGSLRDAERRGARDNRQVRGGHQIGG